MTTQSATSPSAPRDGITAVVHTYNAAEHLREVLDNLKNFDEILVCDMESTDSTLSIAREYGATIMTFPKGNHTCAEPARTTAIQAAACKWTLVVDADEIVPATLRDYLYDFIKNPGETKGLYIPRKNYAFGHFKKSTYPDYQLRFFVKEGTVWPPYVHTFPTVQGRVEYIPASCTELAFTHLESSLTSTIEKMNGYTTAEIAKRGDAKRVTVAKLMIEPAFRFFKSYILKGGFMQGVSGLIQAKNESTYIFYRLAKMYESRSLKDKK